MNWDLLGIGKLGNQKKKIPNLANKEKVHLARTPLGTIGTIANFKESVDLFFKIAFGFKEMK